MRMKARLVIAAVLATALGVVLANSATAQGPYTSSTASSTTTTTSSRPNVTRRVHYSLRFDYSDKHRRVVAARVYCHSTACALSAGGTLRIVGKGSRARHSTRNFKLGNASGTFQRAKGRNVAGQLKFRISRAAARAIAKTLRKRQYGRARVSLSVTGSNPAAPNPTSQKRVRNVKLFAHSRIQRHCGSHKPHGCHGPNGTR